MGSKPGKRYEDNPRIEELFEEVLSAYGDKKPTAFEVLGDVKRRIDEKAKKDPTWHEIPLPAMRKIQMIIKGIRERYEELNPKLKEHLERMRKPWHMGLLKEPDNDIPPEALPAILRVRKLEMLGRNPDVPGRNVFTIRQAKWVARLYSTIHSTWDLMLWSRLYAQTEQMCEVKEIPLDTPELDMSLAMSSWEWDTARRIGLTTMTELDFPAFLGPGGAHTRCLDSLGGVMVRSDEEWGLLQQPTLNPSLGSDDILAVHEEYESVVQRLPSWETPRLTEEQVSVYVLWLKQLRKGPKCKNLEVEDCARIILQLRDWVERNPRARESESWEDTASVGHSSAPDAQSGEFDYESQDMPLELLREVGYEV